jgi:hypothetical protein
LESSLDKQALDYLDDLYENLPEEKSGEQFLAHMERHIRQHNEQLQDAIHIALGVWLRGNNGEKVVYSIRLIGRLSATEYLQALEKLRDELRTGTSRWPSYWLSLIEVVINDLREVEEQATEK